ncbi:Lipid A export ATP-binding/permease protein MsbA [Minicystis rosea]|nr:Lipid A export ATP-binding/permease protein MsbA [Minicystis rosea]
MKLAFVALAAVASITSCARCGSAPSASSTGAASSDVPAASATAAAEADPPEVRDTGRGSATAALRSVLTAHGIAFDAAALERECKVDDDGASIDDLEDVAEKYGLEARQIILPPEHVLLPEAKVLPAIVIVDGPGEDDPSEFFLLWKLDGDRVLVMDPAKGRRWVPRAELVQSLYVHTMAVPVSDWTAAQNDPSFRDALRARLIALGVDRDRAQGIVDRTAPNVGAQTFRAVAALDAAIRQLEAEPGAAAGDAAAFIGKAYDCAAEDKCAPGVEAVPDALWSVRPASKAKGDEVEVRGAVLLAIAGKKPPSP